MDVDKLVEAIMARIEHDRAIHKSSLVEEIQKAMAKPAWNHQMPNMVNIRDQDMIATHPLLSDGTTTWGTIG